jgi:dipeptide/tripeptide permease
MADAAPRKSALQLMKDYFLDFKVLKEVPREYWGVQTVNFLDSIAYFSITTIFTLFLSKELGLDDKQAGLVYTVGAMAVTVVLITGGSIIDWLGIRRAMNLSLGLKVLVSAGIAAMALVPEHTGWYLVKGARLLVAGGLWVLLAPSLAGLQSVFQVANKRFTTAKARSAGYNLWYMFMNVGAFLSGLLIDLFRKGFGWGNTSVVLIGVVTSVLSMVASAALVRTEAQVLGPDESPSAETSREVTKKGPIESLLLIVREPAFWRFVVLLAAFLGVRAVYLHMVLIMPKYWERVIGPDVALGTLEAINPFLIIIGIIVFIPVANKFHVFKQLTFGAMASSASLLVLVLPWRWFSHDVATGYYILSIISMVVLSVGEIFWSPKLYEYTAAIAPEGQEAAYFGFSLLPWFVAKFVVSATSGYMLSWWCPGDMRAQLAAGSLPFWKSPEAMWLVLGLWAMSGPIIALFFEKWLTKGARFKTPADEAKAAEAAKPAEAASESAPG